MKRFRFLVPAIVVVALLLGVMPASAGQPGVGTSTLFVQNADGSGNASVVVTFYNTDGTEAGQSVSVATLAPYVSTEISLTSAPPGLPATWRGSAVVSSDRQVAAVGRTAYTTAVGDFLTVDDYLAVSEPATTAFLSYVFDSSGRNSIISVQNTSGGAATIYLHYYIRIGPYIGQEIVGSASCSASPIQDTIPAGGTVYYDLLNLTRNGVASGGAGGKIPCLGNTKTAGGTVQATAGTVGDFEGAVYITSDQDIAAAVGTYWMWYSTAYVGSASDDTYLFYPQMARQKTPAQSRWNRWSELIVQNTVNFPISVTVNLYGEDGIHNVSFTDNLDPYSSKGYNTRYRGAFSDALWANCSTEEPTGDPDCALETAFGGTNWVGSATVEVLTPGGRITGVGHLFYHWQYAFTYEALQPGAGSNIVVCPFMQDRSGTNDRYSEAFIQNTSTTSNANVDLYVFKSTNVNGGLTNADLVLNNGGSHYVIPPSGRCGANTRWTSACMASTVFDPLGNDWQGSLVVVSQDQPILVSMASFRLDTNIPNEFWLAGYDCYNVP